MRDVLAISTSPASRSRCGKQRGDALRAGTEGHTYERCVFANGMTASGHYAHPDSKTLSDLTSLEEVQFFSTALRLRSPGLPDDQETLPAATCAFEVFFCFCVLLRSTAIALETLKEICVFKHALLRWNVSSTSFDRCQDNLAELL